MAATALQLSFEFMLYPRGECRSAMVLHAHSSVLGVITTRQSYVGLSVVP